MSKKRLISIFVSVLLLSLCGVCYGASGQSIAGLLEGQRAGASSELAEIKEVLLDSADGLNQTIANTSSFETAMKEGKLSRSNPIGGFQIDLAYPLSSLKDPDLVAAYRASGTFKDNISDEYLWKVPTTTGFVVKVRRDASRSDHWREAGFSNEFQDREGIENCAELTDRAQLIQTLEGNGIQAVSSVRYVDAPMYSSTTLLYINAVDGEYLIPYGPRPDLTGLQNGKLYTVKEAVEILSVSSPHDRVYSDIESVEYGGADGHTDSASTPLLWIAVPILLGAVVFIVVLAARARNRRAGSSRPRE